MCVYLIQLITRHDICVSNGKCTEKILFEIWPNCPLWGFYHFASPGDMVEDVWFHTTLPSEFVVKFWNFASMR